MATMKESDDKILDRALKLFEKGTKIKDIMSQTGLNYSQVWNYCNCVTLDPKLRVPEKQRTPTTVKKLRDEGNSWGMIMVRFNYPVDPTWTEGRVRSAYEEAEGIKSEGTRIGKGGRFFADTRELYEGVRQRHGVEIEKPVTRTQVLAVAGQLDPNAVRIKANGAVMKTTGSKVKAVAKSTGVVKSAAKKAPAKATKKAAKKAVAKKTTKKAVATAKDPFEEAA